MRAETQRLASEAERTKRQLQQAQPMPNQKAQRDLVEQVLGFFRERVLGVVCQTGNRKGGGGQGVPPTESIHPKTPSADTSHVGDDGSPERLRNRPCVAELREALQQITFAWQALSS